MRNGSFRRVEPLLSQQVIRLVGLFQHPLSTAVIFTSGDKKVSVKDPGAQVKAGQSDIVTVEQP